MSRRAVGRSFAAMLSLLIALAAGPFVVFAQEDGTVGGTQSGNTNHPSTGQGTTDIWAGVAVDYMFPLRYEVYDEAKKPLEGTSIEHYDYHNGEYVFVGRTDTHGVWETKVPPEYWMITIQGISPGANAAVVDTTDLYSGVGPLLHRVSKQTYQTVEGLADVSVENLDGEATGVVRIYMKAAALPKTGVQNYWMYFAAAGFLLLVASVILFKMLRDDKKKEDQKTTGGQTE